MSIEPRSEPNIERGLRLVVPLTDASVTLEQVGGKAASLARLTAAGLPVPPGFTITTAAYRRFVAENGLQERILAAVSAAHPDHPATLDDAAARIAALFAQNPMPADIAAAIRSAYAALSDAVGTDGKTGNHLAVAVRSSATAEDLPELSFAGQQETYLNVRGIDHVLDAVTRCWASLWTARAIGYRARNVIAPEDVALAVVVQELVDADASGILFTANPVTDARDQVVINAAWGLGEAIVGGKVTPDTFVAAKDTGAIVEEQISQKDLMTVRIASGAREQPVPLERRGQPTLTPEQAAELARLGERIERLYGQPMDVEWALASGRIFVVQARPITALPESAANLQTPRRTPGEDEWPLPNPKGHYYRTSVFELLPDPLSPLFATLGLPAWSNAMRTLFESIGIQSGFPMMMLATINGYGYYDLSLTPAQTARFLLVLPRVAVLFPRLMRTARQRWRDARSSYAALVDHWQAADLSQVSSGDLLRGVQDITDEAATYYLTIQGGILPAAYMSEALFTLAYDRMLKRPGDPAALTFVLGFESEPLRAEKSLFDLARWAREQPELAAGLAGMSGAQFAAAYREHRARPAADGVWAEFWRRLDEHLARFGHAIYDLDFAKPLLADNPTPILETLKYFLSEEAPNPYLRLALARTKRERATRRMLTQLHGPRRVLFRRLACWAQGFAPLREDALADVGLGWPVLRRMLHELGRRLVAAGAISTPDDVYFLTLDELRAAVTALDAGQPMANEQADVAERRARWGRERTLIPPAALPIQGGARFLGIDFSSMMPARIGQSEGDTLKGIAASPGRVAGPARVISGPDEFEQMRQGEILVARITTPAWTPLFALAAGVVTDVGGPLSHSSIVAREYHIPAVLGTGDATERLHSGQRIIVDGDAGTVTLAQP